MAIATLTSNETGANSLIDINNNFADVTTSLALKANLASPTFTGTPTLPTGTTGVTQSASDNSTKLATTAYVDNQVNAGASIISTSVSLSSADILALHSGTGKTLVAAQGANTVIMLVGEMIWSIDYGGTPYANGGTITPVYVGSDITPTINGGITAAQMNVSADTVYASFEPSTTRIDITEGINQPICLKADTAFITGNSTMKVFFQYRVLTAIT